MSPKNELSNTSYALLGFLRRDPMTGYELRREIEASVANFWREGYGQIYPALRKLEELGYVEGEDDSSGGRVRKRYTLLEAGRVALRNWLSEPAKFRPPRSELLLKLFFAQAAAPGDTLALLEAARDSWLAEQEHLRAIEADLSSAPRSAHSEQPFWMATLGFGLEQNAASLRWVEGQISRLDASTGTATAKKGSANRAASGKAKDRKGSR